MKKLFILLLPILILASCSKEQNFNNECLKEYHEGKFRLAARVGHDIMNKNPNDGASNLCMGILARINGDYQDSMLFLNNSLHFAKNHNLLSMAESNLCMVYTSTGQLDKAKIHCENAKTYNPDKDALAEYYIAKGNLLAQDKSVPNNYSEALSYFQKAYRVKNASKFEKALALSYMGLTYYYMGNLDKAKEYMLTAIKLGKEAKNPEALAIAYLSLGELQREQKEYKDALTNLTYGMKYAIDANDTYWTGIGYAYLGFYYYDQKDFIKAKAYLQGAIGVLQIVNATKEIDYINQWLNTIPTLQAPQNP